MKHIAVVKWTGMYREEYVVSCSCGWSVSNIFKRKNADRLKKEHLEEKGVREK